LASAWSADLASKNAADSFANFTLVCSPCLCAVPLHVFDRSVAKFKDEKEKQAKGTLSLRLRFVDSTPYAPLVASLNPSSFLYSQDSEEQSKNGGAVQQVLATGTEISIESKLTHLTPLLLWMRHVCATDYGDRYQPTL
jgi:hypothetical protein